MSTITFLNKIRIEKGARLLETTDEPIHRVAKSVGFTAPLYFSNAFKKQMGMSPLHYRNKERIWKEKTSSVLKILSFALLLSGCKPGPSSSSGELPSRAIFTYQTNDYTPIIGEKRNNEDFDYESLIVNPISGLRDDFAMGVDASMVKTVEENGGVYYNEAGEEQDVFQIMNQQGVNFFRVRIWNTPNNLFGDKYGGGSVNTAEAISMAKRAQAANMNVMVDLHYSDFWADPSNQRTPQSGSVKT